MYFNFKKNGKEDHNFWTKSFNFGHSVCVKLSIKIGYGYNIRQHPVAKPRRNSYPALPSPVSGLSPVEKKFFLPFCIMGFLVSYRIFKQVLSLRGKSRNQCVLTQVYRKCCYLRFPPPYIIHTSITLSVHSDL